MKENVNSPDNLLQSRWAGLRENPLTWMIGGWFLLLLVASSGRHLLFQSGAFDLGYFDQAIYLISHGEAPIVSFWGFHVLGGHADWMVYPLGILYWLQASVYWLFGVQALALAIGALPTYWLARQAGLRNALAMTLAAVYLLYPLVFNLNLFDFHPEVMALPVFLWAVLMARQKRVGWFIACVLFILGCRAALALTVVAMGVWLLLFERRRVCGAIAIVLGTTWFLIAIKLVIPAFRPAGVEAALRYAYLGDSVPAIIKNLFLRPDLLLGRVLSLETLEYLLLLTIPLLWGLSFRHLAPLVAALPQLAMNILSDAPSQRDLVHQYSLPILPFLMLVVIGTLAAQSETKRQTSELASASPRRRTSMLSNLRSSLQTPKFLLLWSLVAFLALAKYGYFGSLYLSSLDTWRATREAISLIQTPGSVLTTHNIVPHLTHRSQIRFTLAETPFELNQFDYILLDVRHPGWRSNSEFALGLVNQLQTDPNFDQKFSQDQVFLFSKRLVMP